MEFSGFSARLGPDPAPARSGAVTHDVGPAFERHYRIGELADRLADPAAVRALFTAANSGRRRVPPLESDACRK